MKTRSRRAGGRGGDCLAKPPTLDGELKRKRNETLAHNKKRKLELEKEEKEKETNFFQKFKETRKRIYLGGDGDSKKSQTKPSSSKAQKEAPVARRRSTRSRRR